MKIDKTLLKKDSRIEYVSGQIEEISSEVETTETQYSGFHQEVSEKRASFKDAKEELEVLEERLNSQKEERLNSTNRFR